QMDCIRPHDDFVSKGIPISAIEDFLSEDTNCYRIPYNPSTHSFEPIKIETIKAIPKDIIVVEFPCIKVLDPIGYARKYGLDQRECLRQCGIQQHFHAEKIKWTVTAI